MDATRAALPALCPACGGETHGRIALGAPGPESGARIRSTRFCSSCAASAAWEGPISSRARDVLERELPAVRRRRARLRPAEPMTLLWVPPTGAKHGAYLDTASMLAARLAEGDPSVHLETSSYPRDPDAPSAAQAALADISILLAPGARACSRALELLGPAIPPSRALVVAIDLHDDERRLLTHRRLITFTSDQVAAGDLFDAVAGTIISLRQVARWRTITPFAAAGEPLGVYAAHETAIRTATDELAAYLLRLADEPAPQPIGRFLADAGGDRAELRASLDSLRRIGAIQIVEERVAITRGGRELLSRLWPHPRSEASAGDADSARDEKRAEPSSLLAQLFRDARDGSQDALGRLLKTGGDTARRIAHRRLGPALRAKVDSTDIAQSVVADLMQKIDGFEFRGDEAWRGYLRRLVENKIRAKADYFGAARRDMRRERSIGTPRGEGDAPDRLHLASGDPSPAEIILKREQIEEVEEALAQLPEAERDVILLRVFEGLSHREIAERMRRPSENAVHKLYGRALARLAGLMGERP